MNSWGCSSCFHQDVCVMDYCSQRDTNYIKILLRCPHTDNLLSRSTLLVVHQLHSGWNHLHTLPVPRDTFSERQNYQKFINDNELMGLFCSHQDMSVMDYSSQRDTDYTSISFWGVPTLTIFCQEVPYLLVVHLFHSGWNHLHTLPVPRDTFSEGRIAKSKITINKNELMGVFCFHQDMYDY